MQPNDLTSSQIQRIQVLTSEQEILKNKKKKKSKENADTSQTQSSEKPAARPGKKKARKLRYQQRHSCPTEFLFASSAACKFTGSVALDGTEVSSIDDGSQFSTTPLPKGVKVQVVTCCELPPKNTIAFSRSKELEAARTIFVQPLLVLDLNGIMCHRVRVHRALDVPKETYRPAIAHIAGTPVIPRTDLVDFISFLDRHFCLAVWTSAKQKNAKLLVKELIPSPIADRLLFIRAQHDCDKIHVENIEDPLFEKDLAKVWKDYPLWNAQNTILLDDSHDKCQKWHENAVHPPSLHGRKADQLDESMMPDEVNERLQREFFEGIVQRLTEQPVITEWLVTDTKASDEHDQSEEKSQNPFTVASPPVLLDYLRQKAVGHMGWT